MSNEEKIEFLEKALCDTENKLYTVSNELEQMQNSSRLVEELLKRAIPCNNRWELEVHRGCSFNFNAEDPTKRTIIKRYRVFIYEVNQ
jgi:hypothetical protein